MAATSAPFVAGGRRRRYFEKYPGNVVTGRTEHPSYFSASGTRPVLAVKLIAVLTPGDGQWFKIADIRVEPRCVRS